MKVQDCPLCGPDFKIHVGIEAFPGEYSVQCRSCWMYGPERETEEEAIEDWNKLTIKEKLQ